MWIIDEASYWMPSGKAWAGLERKWCFERRARECKEENLGRTASRNWQLQEESWKFIKWESLGYGKAKEDWGG